MRYPVYLDYPPRRRRLLVTTSVSAAALLAALTLGQLPWATVSNALASSSKRTVITERATEHPSGSVGRSDSADADTDAASDPDGDSSGGDSGSSDPADEKSGNKDSDSADPAGDGSGSAANTPTGAPAGNPIPGVPAGNPIPGVPASGDSAGEGPQVPPGVGGGRAAGGASHPKIATPAVPRAPAPSRSTAAAAVPDRASEERGTDNESSDDNDAEATGGKDSEGSGSDEQKHSEAGVRSRSGSGSASSGDVDDAPPAREVSLPAPGEAARSSSQAAADSRAAPTSVPCTRTVSIAQLARATASAGPDEVLCVERDQQQAPSASTESSRSPGQAASTTIGSGTPRDDASTGTTSTVGTGERWTIRIPWLSGMGCMTMPNSQGDSDQQGLREITVCGPDGDSVTSPKSSASRSSGDERGDR